MARDLQHLLGYKEWRNFNLVINKAKTACEVSEQQIDDHFVDVNKMVTLSSGSEREIEDIMLTRFACYLITQNGDPRKNTIAFAQRYFAVQTRKAELIEKKMLEHEMMKTTTTQTENADYKITYENTGEVFENGYVRMLQIEEGVSKHIITSGKRVDVLALLLQVPYPTKSVSDFEYKIEIFVDGELKESYMTELTTTNYGNSNSTHKHLYKIDGGLVLFP